MNSELAVCLHCGTKFVPTDAEPEFCCAGCRFVNQWIGREGLEQFYDLKGATIITVVGNSVFEPADWDWLNRLNPETNEMEFGLEGMSCLACAWLIEKRFEAMPGAVRIDVYPESGRAHMTWEGSDFSPIAFFRDLAHFGYRATKSTSTNNESGNADRSLMVRAGVCGSFALNAMAFTLPSYFGLNPDSDFAPLFSLISMISATFAVLVGGSYFFQHAWRSIRQGILHIDLPIAMGIFFAYVGSLAGWAFNIDGLFYADFVATFVFLMIGGRWVQQRALSSAQLRLSTNTESLADGVDCELNSIKISDLIEIRPGAVVPVEANVGAEPITISLEWITGEPEALTRQPGQAIPAGARLLNREPAKVRARESFGESLLSQLAGNRGAPRDRFLERVLKVYLIAVLGVAVIGGGIWLACCGLAESLQVLISVLVVSCPCALGVAIPLVDAWVAARLKNHGVFVREPSLWGRLRRVNQVAFDKTGTLTLPTPSLTNPDELKSLDRNAKAALLRLVADNRHPAARSLHEALLSSAELPENDSAEVNEEPGLGVRFVDSNGTEWSLGRAGWKTNPGIRATSATVFFARNRQLLAAFAFDEAPRPGAADELGALRRIFPKLAVLSGDRPERVWAVCQDLGFDKNEVLGNLSPSDKADWLREHDPDRTLFLGDGANDSLGFDVAHCSGMPGSHRGVLESKADFFFVGRGLRALRELFGAANDRRRGLTRVVSFAIFYNLIAVALCLAGWMSPLLAAILMPISSVITIAIARATSRRPGEVRGSVRALPSSGTRAALLTREARAS